ncbi:Hypothetical protein CAP_4579 [Chondromyces apiculatus DSM 436]|uniref:Uncharacterized protein n=1 Tax=Chondromyces apiculatus DSM 436 TaxID=1192034 RepID=A0A017T690_9BACT|nr:Hypothetical protein CAP_4579 [Chondromyces apiculatus DSM 436]
MFGEDAGTGEHHVRARGTTYGDALLSSPGDHTWRVSSHALGSGKPCLSQVSVGVL